MEEDGQMSNKVATCLYMNKEVVETARKIGLNLSKVSENALIESISRLRSPKQETEPYRAFVGEGRDRDLNPGARLHRPIGYQATSPRPHFVLSYF
jgi:post-segregation antitoxin (ccd killing protein)